MFVFWLHQVFVATCRLSLVAMGRGYFIGCALVEECVVVALLAVVPSLLDVVASVVVVHGP